MTRKISLIYIFFIFLLSGCASYRPLQLNRINIRKATSLSGIKKTDLSLYEKIVSGKSLSLKDVAETAVLNNKGLKYYRAGEEMAGAQILKAREIPNPTLGLDAARPVMGKMAGAFDPYDIIPSLDLSFLNGRGHKIKAAELTSASVRLNVIYREWQTAEKAKLDAIELYYLQKEYYYFKNEFKDFTESYSIEKKLYNGGMASINELDLYESSLNKSAALIAEMRKKIGDICGNLKIILGLPVSYRINISAGKINIKLPLRKVLESGLQQRPDMEALRVALMAGNQTLRAAIAGQFPSFSINLPFTSDNTDIQSAGLGLGITLPLFNRNEAAIEGAKAKRRQVFNEYISRLESGRVMINTILKDIIAEKKQISLLRARRKNLLDIYKVYKRSFRMRQTGIFEFYSVRNSLLDENIALLKEKELLYGTVVSLEIESGKTLIGN